MFSPKDEEKQMSATRQRRCPECRRRYPEAEAWAFAPFCCERCKMADLGRWLGGEHAIPGEPASPEDLAAYLPQSEDERSS
jgi:uncharacterized protein